ncbi:hypothetical protein FRC10_008491 [Ceratobasidium sp. 414]|nr:hypothetical protein FRC10_008491 [Ceratobasidium sp. 414]
MSFDSGADRGVKRKGPTTDLSDDNEPKSRGRAAIKVRCDNPNVAYDGPCTRCTRLSLDCLYQEKKRGRKPKNDNPEERQNTYVAQAKTPSSSAAPPRAGSSNIREFASVLDSRAPRPPDPRGLTGTTSTPPYGTPAFLPIIPIHEITLFIPSLGSGDRDLGARKRDDAKMYTLANIMSDKSPASDNPANVFTYMYGLSPIDRLEDPLQAEFVTEAEVDQLFYSYAISLLPSRFFVQFTSLRYFAHLNSIIGLLDPRLHTSSYVRQRSRVLFTTIIAVSSKFFLPHVHEKCHALSQSLIGRALAADMCNIEYIQALSLSTFYKDADDSSSWRKVGLAIRMAYELNLQEFRRGATLPTEEIEARKQLIATE